MKFYCFDGEEVTIHDTEQLARAAALQALAHYRADSEHGWSPDVEQIEYGRLVGIGGVIMTDRTERCDLGPDGGPCDDDELCDMPHDFDYTCDYQLVEPLIRLG